MNNFIVGQVSPTMIAKMSYGVFIFFGGLITLGAGFIWFFVPETKQLSLEEMDLIFGSSGVAEADKARMAQINAEVGLDAALERAARGTEKRMEKEQAGVLEKTS